MAKLNLTMQEQTSILVDRGEVRESGLTGVTRNHVSRTAPGVRIPPSPPPSLQFGDSRQRHPKSAHIRLYLQFSWQQRQANSSHIVGIPVFSLPFEFHWGREE